MKQNRFFSDLSVARAYYFSFMGGWGFILPFMNLYFVSLGFNGKQVGIITSVSAIVGMVISPVMVSEVKKRPQARIILQFALLLSGIGYYLIGSQQTFAVILAIVFFHAMVTSGILPVSDSMAVKISQQAGSGYGNVRVFGSLGWIVTLLSSGWLVSRFGFIAAFSGVGLMMFLSAIVIQFLGSQSFTSTSSNPQPRSGLITAFQTVRKDSVLTAFALALVFIGFLNNGVLQFENVFLAELGASKQLISIAGILSAIVELPFMIFSDRILKRVGAFQLLLTALALTLLQRLAVLSFPFITTIMITRFAGGVAFSFYTVAFIGLISERTQPAETGTVLALFTVTIAGMVNIVAAPISGAIFDLVGGRWLYALSASGYLIGCLLLFIQRWRAGKAADLSVT